jgi:kynureninase
MNFEFTQEFALQQDESDPLKNFRQLFHIPTHHGKETIYFTGNSLGLQPKSAAEYVRQELDDWATLGVEGHFHAKNPWLPYHEIFPAQLSSLAGCKPSEVVVMNQLTVNLHLLMVTFYRPTKSRYKIICEGRAFPSDQYAFESQARYHGFDPAEAVIEINPRANEHLLRTEDILAAIEEHGESIAVVIFGGVNYYTGQFFDLAAITEAAHRVGAFAGFDLAHAIGNVELKLHEWKIDFACWCSYKYLNSGPGGVAGVYIHESHASNSELPRFAGWWGHTKETRFRMEKGFEAIPTAEGWQLSNAPILSMAVHKASLDIFTEAGMGRLHQKRKLLAGWLHFVLNELNNRGGGKLFTNITPPDEDARGCQVSLLMHTKGREVFASLMEQGVIGDWREPNVIRIAPVPLYNSFKDVWKFGKIIERILLNE